MSSAPVLGRAVVERAGRGLEASEQFLELGVGRRAQGLGERRVEVAPEREHDAGQRQHHERARDRHAAQPGEPALDDDPEQTAHEIAAEPVPGGRGRVEGLTDLGLQPRLLVQPDLEIGQDDELGAPIRSGSKRCCW